MPEWLAEWLKEERDRIEEQMAQAEERRQEGEHDDF